MKAAYNSHNMTRFPPFVRWLPVLPLGLIVACASSGEGPYPSLAVRPGMPAGSCAPLTTMPGTAATDEAAASGEAGAAQEPARLFDIAARPEPDALSSRFADVRAEWRSLRDDMLGANGARRDLLMGRVESRFLQFAAMEADLAIYRAQFADLEAFASREPDLAALWEEFAAFREEAISSGGGVPPAATARGAAPRVPTGCAAG